MAKRKPRDTFQAERCAAQLKALGEPLRLLILDVLQDGPLCVGEVAKRLKIAFLKASHHLRLLKQANLVEVRRNGRLREYRLREGLIVKPRRSGGRQFLDLGCCRLEVQAPVANPS